MRSHLRPLLLGLLALALAPRASSAEARGPVKVFLLAGQSNMEGQAVADLDGKDYNHGKGESDRAWDEFTAHHAPVASAPK